MARAAGKATALTGLSPQCPRGFIRLAGMHCASEKAAEVRGDRGFTAIRLGSKRRGARRFAEHVDEGVAAILWDPGDDQQSLPSYSVRPDPRRYVGPRDGGEGSQAPHEGEPVVDRMGGDFLIWRKVQIKCLSGR
jgi:hypothetical protein